MESIDIIKSNYIRELLMDGVREDSRGLNDFRSIKVAPGVIEHAEGSAQVDLGSTRVLAGVKLIMGEPMSDTPDQGTMSMAAELLPLASADYETGPPSPDSIELARVVDRGIRAGNCIDLADLLVAEGKAWSVYADLYILNYDGNLFDAGELAVMSALMNTKVPKYEDDKVIREERIKDIKLNNIVTSATFAKIGDKILLDMNRNEGNAADARLTVATDGSVVRAMQKGLNGGITVKEIDDMVDTAMAKHVELKSIMEKATKRSL